MIKAIGLALYGRQAASTRYRLSQYAPGLRAAGIDLTVEGLLDDDYLQKTFRGEKYGLANTARAYARRAARLPRLGAYDVAIVNAELFPLLPGWIESRLLRIPYIYDFDDAFFEKYRSARFRRVSFLLKDKFDSVVARAAAVTAGNEYLATYARSLNANTHVLPTVVDTDRYRPAPMRTSDSFTIGWVGSPSTGAYLPSLFGPLAQLGREGPVRFVVVGAQCPAIEGVEVVNVAWSEATEIDTINTFDAGVMPLPDDEWARGKCAFKLIQYMACGVPSVASPVGANVTVAANGAALLADEDAEWLAALRRLRDDADLRARLSQAGRARVEQTYSLQATLPTMAEIIKSVD